MEAVMDRIGIEKYPAYKDSGVEWLGKIPNHWETKPGFTVFEERKEKNIGLKERTVLSLSYGNVIIKPEEKLTGLVPESFETYQLVYPGDIIIRPTDLQNDKTSLRTGLAKNKGIITSAYINLKVKEAYNCKFFHYFLHAIDLNKIIYGLGSGLRQNLDYGDFKRFRFLCPPKEEQTAIANFLDHKTAKIDKAIAQKEKLIELLKERRQILIHRAVTRGLDPNVKMKDSGVEWIGEIPEHWEVKKLKYLSSYFKGNAFSSTDFVDEGIPIVKASNIKLWNIENITSFIAIENQQNTFQKFRLKSGDIIVSTVGSKPEIKESAVGQLAVINKEYDGAYLNQNTVCIRPNSAIVKSFLKLVFTSNYVRSSFDSISLWIANQAYLEVDSIMEIQIPIPPKEEQKIISIFLEELNLRMVDAISIKVREIEKLKEYKATLINAAVTGKIKVA